MRTIAIVIMITMTQNKKYKVQWCEKDNKGIYTTFIYAQNIKEAKIYAETAHLDNCWNIKIIKI